MVHITLHAIVCTTDKAPVLTVQHALLHGNNRKDGVGGGLACTYGKFSLMLQTSTCTAFGRQIQSYSPVSYIPAPIDQQFRHVELLAVMTHCSVEAAGQSLQQVAVTYLLAGHTAAADPTWTILIVCAFCIHAVFGGMVINSCGSPSCIR